MATEKEIQIRAPNMATASFGIRGTAPFVQLRFSAKVQEGLLKKHMEGSQAKKGKKREAKDPEALFEEAMYLSTDGWRGIPASSFRKALVSACRLVGFKMTLAKLGVFIEPDGFDAEDGTPLIRIQGEPALHISHTRNATGVPDIRIRAMWREWAATVRITYDADLFNEVDVANLLMRVGMQVGIGEGRPDSRESVGMGWGTFRLGGKE